MTLRLKLTDKSKLKLIANTNFCNAELFEKFCQELERTLTRYAREHQGTLVRKPSFFEKKWVLMSLISGSLIITWLLIRLISLDRGIGTALAPAGIFAMLWAAWFNTRRKLKKAAAKE